MLKLQFEHLHHQQKNAVKKIGMKSHRSQESCRPISLKSEFITKATTVQEFSAEESTKLGRSLYCEFMGPGCSFICSCLNMFEL